MKCVKNGSSVKRVTEQMAERMIKSNGYKYCSKTDWKNAGKIQDETIEHIKTPKKTKNTKKTKKVDTTAATNS